MAVERPDNEFTRFRRLVGAGIPREVFEGIRDMGVAPGVSVKDYAEGCVDWDEMYWDKTGEEPVLRFTPRFIPRPEEA